MDRIKILQYALKRGRFIEIDAKQFYGNPAQHFGAGLDAMIVDNNRSLVAHILLEEAPMIELHAKEIGYAVGLVEKDEIRATYRFTMPPAE